MQKVKKIGGDIGNDTLKIYLEEANAEGKTKLEIMNVVAPGYDRRILGVEKGHLSNLLDVNIEADGKDIGRYFVGGLAFKDNRGDLIEKNKRDVKATNLYSIILLVTGLAYALFDEKELIKTETIALGTLLPTEEFWDDELVKKFAESFKKEYTVKFNSPVFKGAKITLNIVDHDIQPESAAGLIASIYDFNGKPKKGMENIEHEVHLGIFIGSITTEVAVYEYGDFNPKGFFGLELGTSDPLDRIIDDLGLNMSRHQVDYFIRTGKKLLVSEAGKTVDKTEKLEKIKEAKFGFFVKQLVNQLNKKLAKQGVNADLITNVDMGGGGSITVLNDFKKEFNLASIKLVDDARFANALGALLSIIQKQNEQEVAADEVLNINQKEVTSNEVLV